MPKGPHLFGGTAEREICMHIAKSCILLGVSTEFNRQSNLVSLVWWYNSPLLRHEMADSLAFLPKLWQQRLVLVSCILILRILALPAGRRRSRYSYVRTSC